VERPLSGDSREGASEMKVSEAIKYLQKADPDEQIIISWFDRYAYEDYFNDEDKISPEKWANIVSKVDDNERYWQSNNFALEEAIEQARELAK